MQALEAAGLSPAASLDREGLIRRLFFDLVGVPPTPAQVDAFLADTSPAALERLVDSLLQSPQFGERWGRHWLDLVRYAESRGHEFDNDADNAFQYRDYVIRGLNADVPYDQWIMEHLAGDLLSEPRLNPQDGFNESVLGTGFWFLGEWVHSPVDIRKDEADRFDNMIDVMSKAFLGVTVACARCHDHKFDAISTADYYALSGFLQSSDYRQVRFDTVEQDRQIAEQLAQLDQSYRQRIASVLADHPLASAAPSSSAQQLTSFAAPEAADGDKLLIQQEPYVLVDYSHVSADDYMQDGHLFGPAPRRPGELYLATTEIGPRLRVVTQHAAASDPFWNGLVSHSGPGVQLNGKLRSLPMSGRTLRTPTVLLQHGQVACQVRGGGHVIACVDSHRLVAGPLHGETIVRIPPSDQWQWVTVNLDRYVGHRLHLEFVPDEDALLEVSLITQGASPQQQAHLLLRQQEQARLAEQTAEWIERAWADDLPTSDHLRQLVAQWAQERDLLRQQVRTESRLAMAMIDGSGEDDHVLIRGNASQPGPIVPRRFLSALDGQQPLAMNTRSGRLELAARINDRSNPLAHRVIVNRIWHYLMGRGIVATTDDFGVLGQSPTHPELLDHLAERFLQDGRSIKRMIRYIVLSKTYQMSSRASAAALQQDPKNLLWHHRPPKRLEGEAIRDALLTVSGRLNATMQGPSVPIHLTSFMEGRGRPPHSGPLDGDGRRSIYIAVRRNFLSPFMLAFDTPVPFSTMGRRNVSNVPAQALILMNDPFVAEQARQWALRVLEMPAEELVKAHGPAAPVAADPAATAMARVTAMYRAAFARPPQPEELAAALDYLLAADAAGPAAEPADSLARWTDFAQRADQYQRVHFSAMITYQTYPCARFRPLPLSRREMLGRCASGFGAVALAALHRDSTFAASGPADAPGGLADHGPHHAPRATRVIFLYMDGGPSQVDTFDPKPLLDRYNGREPGELFKVEATQFNNNGKVLASPWKFQQYGQSGIPVSELFPYVSQHVDRLAVIRSMVSEFPEHTFANYFLHTGSGLQGRPSMGAWLNYGLGSESHDLPGFVVINGGLIPPGGLDCFGSGFLPASYQGSVFKPSGMAVANIQRIEATPQQQASKMSLMRRLDAVALPQYGSHDSLDSAIKNYELAYQMQMAVPDLMSLSEETQATQTMYGMDAAYEPTRIYAAQCLLARRLVERGVRFIELTCPNVGADRWDQHSDLQAGHQNNARAVDQPIGALLTDLHQRGLLDETLVVWAGEFGRTPFAQGADGRDHNPFGFTVWMAGGGVRPGTIYGATDDWGYKAIENRAEIHDLHATMLHLLGVDHTRSTYRFGGRDMRLTDVKGHVIHDVIA